MDNAVNTADRATGSQLADPPSHPVSEPRAVSLQDYQAITRAREEFVDFLLARTELPA